MNIAQKAVRELKVGYYKLFPSQKPFYQDVKQLNSIDQGPDHNTVAHVGFFVETGNAGDTVLPIMVRDLIDFCSHKPNNWDSFHAHAVVTSKRAEKINNNEALVIGGGGLFLKDTNENNKSGWQWTCSLSKLKKIKRPIAVFAVGYNRFRGQEDFGETFRQSLKLLTEKSVFVGLRNYGSVKAIRSYLPKKLQHKVRFQPCPTTLAKNIYPHIIDKAEETRCTRTIALNYANDRVDMRLGERKEDVLNNLALCMKRLSNEGYKIELFAHLNSDEKIVPYLKAAGVPFKIIKLYKMNAAQILEHYTRPTVAVGMRGHAQMIPFGCGTPIVSLISHDKLAWFLEDIGRSEWGIEMLSENFGDNLFNLIIKTVMNKDQITRDIFEIQKELLSISQQNVNDLRKAV